MDGSAARGDRALCVIAHLSFWAFPLVIPLGLYLSLRKRRSWVAAHGAEAFNFHLSFAVLVVISVVFEIFVAQLAVAAFIALGLWGIFSSLSRAIAAARDTLKPYRGPVFRLVHRPTLLTSPSMTPAS